MIGGIMITDIADFGAMLTSLKALADIAKFMIDARDASVIRAKAAEWQREVIATQSGTLTAQAAQFALLKRVDELEKEMADLKAWDVEKQKYELKNVRKPNVFGGAAFAYALKEETSLGEPAHFICPDCYEERRKSILQHVFHHYGRTDTLSCNRCHLEINLTGVQYDSPPPRQQK
jgi:hypothetical protein